MNWRWLLQSFEGRINRGKFWVGSIVLWGISIIVNAVISTVFGMQFVEGEIFPVMGPVSWLLWVLAALAIAYATLAVWAKRWHDRDKSGWWSLIALIPFIGAIWMLVECGCLPGTEGPNRYGPDPLAS